ncbi:hypothetical protein ACVQ8P_06650 [Dellaglioa sp. BT-FLS60]
MLKNTYPKLSTIYKSITILCFSLLFFTLSVHNAQADQSYTPPKGYPMGAATNVTGFAGGKITFNSNQINDLQGQFFAKTFASSGGNGGGTDKYLQNYVHDDSAGLTDADYDQVNPSMISENLEGLDMIAWYANQNSFIFSKTKNLTYYLEKSPSDNDIARAVSTNQGIKPTDSGYDGYIKQFNAKKDTADTLADFPDMANNNIKSFDDAAQNITDVSDYYAGFTSTNYADSKANGSTTKHNDAIKSVDLNTDKAINASNTDAAHVIQLTIDMDTTSTDQGVVLADIDGNIPYFKDATAIFVNLVNFDVKTMKMPFLILNYKHYSNNSAGISFNFNEGSWMTFNAYPPASDGTSLNYKLDGNNKGTLFTGQNSNGSDTKATSLLTDDPTAIDTTGKNPKKVKSVYNTSSHIVNNFNTENGQIFVGSWKSPLYGSVLAPSADINIDATANGQKQSVLYGSIITGQNIIGNLTVPSDLAYQSIFNASDDFGDDSVQDFLKNPDSSNSTHPTIKSISLPGYTSTDTSSGTTHYIPQVTPYDFYYSLNNITAEIPKDTVQTTKDSFNTTINVDTKSTADKTNNYFLWYSFNDGPWEKYSKGDTTELTSSKLEITAKETNALEKYYNDKHAKYKYDETPYTDGTTYSKAIGDNELIGYHLFHKNKISYLVTSTTDSDTYSDYGGKTVNELLSSTTGDPISASKLAKLNSDYTPISYNLHVTGDLLASYPKSFDFGTVKLGEIHSTLTKTGVLTVDNPLGLNWDLTVNADDSNNPSNPFFIPEQLGWSEKLQTSTIGDDPLTYGNPSALTTIKSKDPVLDLNSSIFSSDTTSIINKNYYSSQLLLELQTKKIAKSGDFKSTVTWSISSPDEIKTEKE